jgi:hypothetical protein
MMKKLLIIILSYYVVACRVISTTEQDEKKVNTFITENMSIVKSQKKGTKISDKDQKDSTFTFEKSVEILEKITDIYAEKEQTYFATKIIDDAIISKWANWLNKNKKMLVWDNSNNRINRKDKDIYSGKLLPHIPN